MSEVSPFGRWALAFSVLYVLMVLANYLQRRLDLARQPIRFNAVLLGWGRTEDGERPCMWTLGFPTVYVAPGTSKSVSVVAQEAFRPTRLGVDPGIAPDFLIERFEYRRSPSTETVDQLTQAVPAQVFSEPAPQHMELETVREGYELTLTVRCEPRPRGIRLLTRKLRTKAFVLYYRARRGLREQDDE